MTPGALTTEPTPPFTAASGGPSGRRTYRGAIMGLGGIARQAHLPGFLADAGIRERLHIVAAVDGAPHVSPVEGIAHLTDRAALADLAPIDFVDICTPTASHLELTLWALEQGYHVLCEKPVALTRAEAARIAAAARAAGRIVMPCHQYRFNPAWQAVRTWLDAGVIGNWHLAEFHVYRMMADRGTGVGATPWRGLRADARGGVLLDHGTHLIYQMLDAAGMPSGIRAWTGQLRHHDYDVEDTAHLVFEYPGRIGVMFLTWAARHRENRIRFIGEEGSIEWTGGMLRLERGGVVETRDFTAELDKSAYPSWFASLFRSFADAMDAGDAEPALDDVAAVSVMLEAAYESGRRGCRAAVHR